MSGIKRSTHGAVVLTGGQSNRMGSPKEWLSFGGVPLLRRVVDVVRSAASPVVVVRSQGQKIPNLPQDVIVTEDQVPDCGPLAGLAAGLAVVQGQCDTVYLSSCDTPLLKPEFIEMIVGSLGDADLAVPWVGGRYHPLSAAYRLRLLHPTQRLLAAGRRRLLSLMTEGRVKVLEEGRLRMADPELLSLKNCNTPSDYQQLVKLWSGV